MIRIFILLLAFSLMDAYSQKKRDSFFKNKTKLKNPFGLRDPFKAPIKRKEKSRKKQLEDDGVFSNLPTIEDVPLSSIQITGVFLGRNRRATARITGERGKGGTVILKEGMRLGVDQAELKAILPGGVVLVEKIINVYGQEEYLETIIPIVGD